MCTVLQSTRLVHRRAWLPVLAYHSWMQSPRKTASQKKHIYTCQTINTTLFLASFPVLPDVP